jgi:DNA-binding NarL/FixJ family response regulator
VFILSGHELVRQALAELLEQEGFDVVGEEARIGIAVPAIAASCVDVGLLSNRLVDGTGIEACRALRVAAPATGCIIMSTYDEHKALRAVGLAGAAGLFLQSTQTHRLIETIRRVAAGEQLHTSEAAQAALRTPPIRPLLADAPGHERAILCLMVQGRTDTEIQTELALPADAFSAHLRTLLARLGYRPAAPSFQGLGPAGDKPPLDPCVGSPRRGQTNDDSTGI